MRGQRMDGVTAKRRLGRKPRYRPVTIVNAGARKPLELRVEVPVEDMARLGEVEELPSGPASQGPKRTSIWQSSIRGCWRLFASAHRR